MKKHQTSGFLILGIILLVVLFASSLIFNEKSTLPKEINQSEFLSKLANNEFKSVAVRERDLSITAKDGKIYHTVMSANVVAQDRLLKQIEESKVTVTQQKIDDSGKWFNVITPFLIPLVVIVLFFVVLRSAQASGSQAMSFGKSRAKLMPENKVKITFKDVAGINESKQELEEIVDFLKNADKYQRLGARIPRGVLLVGAPGTGKTLLAKAVAGEAGVPFFSISGSDFVEMFVGVGASRVRDLFEQAKKHSPCIIFIDEIDAVGRQRGAGMGGGHDEREQTLNQLLVEMDGFDSTTGIIVVAATNRPDILDNALLRPGRFDRQVTLDRPDINGREEILRVHVKGKPLADDVDLRRLARGTSGFSGADLENLINEGALLAARENKDKVEMIDLEQSIDKVVVGPEKKSKVITEKNKEITAYHEVGHSLIRIMVPSQYRFRKVTIIPRGFAMGISWGMPEEDNSHVTKTQLLGEICVGLGGRVAEDLIYNEISTGASEDIKQATSLARRIVMDYGMSDRLGPIKLGNRNEHVFMGRDFGHERDYSEEIASTIDREVKGIIDTEYDRAYTLLANNRDMMDAIVKVLLEQETLDDKEVAEIMDRILVGRGEEPKYVALACKDDDRMDKVKRSEVEVPIDHSTTSLPEG